MKEIQTQRINTYLDALRAYPPEWEALITENERYTFGELIEAAERGQVRGRERRVEHVEVFRDGEREELPSSGRPRPLPGHRRAHPTTPSFAKSPITKRR